MKHKTWNRALSLVMSIVMLVSLLCVPAAAEEPDNSSSGQPVAQANETIEIDGKTYTKLSLVDGGILSFWEMIDDTEHFVPTGLTYWQAGSSEDNYILYIPHSDGTPDEIIMHDATINGMLPGSSNLSCTITLEGNNYIKGSFATHGHDTRNWKITGDSSATLHISDSLYSFQITKGTLTIDQVKVYSNTKDALWADSGLFLTNDALLDVTVTNSDAYGLYFTFPNNGDCLSVTGGSTLNIHATGSDTIGILEGNLGDAISSFGITVSDNSVVSIDGDMALYAMNTPCNISISDSTFTANGTSWGLYAKNDSTLSLENSTFIATGNKAINSKLAVNLVYDPCRIVSAGETTDDATEVNTPDAATYASKYVKVERSDTHSYGDWTLVEGDNTHEKRICVRCGHEDQREVSLTVSMNDWTYSETASQPSIETTNMSAPSVTYYYKQADAEDNAYSTGVPTEAGNYIIKAVVTNNGQEYTATSTFTINPKPITVTADAKSKVYGEADPELTYTVNENGLVEGDSLTGALTRVAGTDAGSYEIQQGTLANSNYAITFVGAILTITAKEVTPTVELSPSSFAYDGTEKEPSVTLKDGDTVIPSSEYDVAYSNNTNVGTEAVVTITDKEGGNYTFAQITRNFTITPKGVTPVVSMTGYEYGSTPSTPAVRGNDSLGAETVYYSTYSDLATNPAHRIEWKDMTGTTLNVGTYYMMAHVAATDNYAEGNSTVIAFKITPAKYPAPSVPAVNAFTVTINEADREKKLEYSLDGTNWSSVPKLDSNGSFELSGLSENSNYHIYLRQKASADGNYLASDKVSTAFTTPTKYSVAYNANLGTGSVPASVTKNSGESVTVASGSSLRRTGYTFADWNTAADGSGTSYAVGASISNGATLYAQWTANSYTVKFNANSGTGTMADQEFTYDAAATALRSNTFTKENYYFAGWATSTNGSVTYTDGQTVKNLAANGSVTLYAVWVENQYSISGNVTSDSSTNVTVKLMRGNTQVGSSQAVTMSGSNAPYTGTYNFTDIPAGTYNIVATQGDKTVTALVVVKNGNETANITMPSGEINSILDVKEATPSVVVGGLDDEATTRAEESKSVTITMTVESQEEQQLPESATEEAKQTQEAISEIKSEASNKTLEFMNIGVEKEVKNGVTVESTEKLSETNNVMEIVIPFDLSGKNNITVYRHHNGTVQTFAESTDKTDGTFYVDHESNLIYVYAKYFSTYAIGYTTKSSGGHTSGGSSSGSAATYPVDVKSATNGSIKADKSSAAKDSTVTITVTPDKGYELGKLIVTDKNGKTISVTAKGNGQYTFTMPAGSVTVAASFVETDWNLAYRNCPKDSTCPIWPFTDAKTTDWYHDGVHFCLENGLMVGYGNNIFQPDAGTTRAMIAVMLWRLNGSPVVNYAMNFDDVKADAWYTEAIRWAASEGVAAGYGNGKFGPDDAMTREQMVTILWRYAQYKGYDVSVGEDTNILSYDDATTVAQYAIPAMQWACGSGMVAGKTQGSGMILDPKGSTTRAQMATMMMRFCAEIVK